MKLTKELMSESLLKIAGDMAIKDLSPQDANSGGRIIKNMRICGSGLYEYHVSEAPLMGLVIPSDYHGDTFKMFRSPEVLVANKDLYARVPIITGHHVRVNTGNAKQLAVGMVGDTVLSEVGEDGETYLYTTGTIIAGDGIEAYEKYGELSVGYDPIVEWMPGDYKGQAYQAVLKGFNEINHLLICQTARGGHQCMIMDSIEKCKEQAPSATENNNGGKEMDFFKKIFGSAKKTETINGDAKVASVLLQSIKAGADAKTQVEAVKKMLGDSCPTEVKEYLDELCGDEITKAPKDVVAKAVDIVDSKVTALFGDEDVCPKCGKEPCECTESEGDEKPAEEKKPEAEETKSNGDAIDYDKLATMVAEKLSAKAEKQSGDEEQMGDENKAEYSRLDALIAGDENTEKVSSDNLMKEIWG